MSTLRERCAEMIARLSRDAILRQGDPVETLLAFVIAENGKAGEPALSDAKPLCLYFGTDEDRDEFVSLWLREHPGARTVKFP